MKILQKYMIGLAAILPLASCSNEETGIVMHKENETLFLDTNGDRRVDVIIQSVPENIMHRDSRAFYQYAAVGDTVTYTWAYGVRSINGKDIKEVQKSLNVIDACKKSNIPYSR